MLSGETLARSISSDETPIAPESRQAFDLEGYLAQHSFVVARKKKWAAHPSGVIFELAQCPFNPDHTHGSAAFYLLKGIPTFGCKHCGCTGKKIQHVFEKFAPTVAVAVTSKSRSSATHAEILLELLGDTDLFRSEHGEPFASLPVGDHREVWPIKSNGFRHWLSRAFYQKYNKTPTGGALQETVNMAEARAQFDSLEQPVFTRVAPFEGGICIDLCNERREAVVVTPEGWYVSTDHRVRFRRPKGLASLPTPVHDGSIKLFRELINIGSEKNWILLASWLVAALRPTGPYPVLVLAGEQGSAKSTAARFIRMLIDPSISGLRTPPREERDLFIAAKNSWVIAYDNLSGIPPWLSDALCRISTGTGYSARELYSDTEEVFITVTRPVILTGIDYLTERSDLADRAIILNLPRIDQTARRDEAFLYAEFQRVSPEIFGALLVALSSALAHLPLTKLNRTPRLADFALWATAAEQGLGFRNGAFIDAWQVSRAAVVRETLEAEIVGTPLVNLIEDDQWACKWTGSAGRLLECLKESVGEALKRSPAWPKSPRAFTNHLRRIIPFLSEIGIQVAFQEQRGTGGLRLLTITREPMHFSVPTVPIVPAQTLTSNCGRDGAKPDSLTSATPKLKPSPERANSVDCRDSDEQPMSPMRTRRN